MLQDREITQTDAREGNTQNWKEPNAKPEDFGDLRADDDGHRIRGRCALRPRPAFLPKVPAAFTTEPHDGVIIALKGKMDESTRQCTTSSKKDTKRLGSFLIRLLLRKRAYAFPLRRVSGCGRRCCLYHMYPNRSSSVKFSWGGHIDQACHGH